MRSFKKLLRKTASVLLLLVFAVGIYVFISVLTSGSKVPSIFGYSFLKVSSGSMEPELETGTVIIVKKIKADAVKEGDIICFYSRDPQIFGIPNTHRVSEIGEENGERVFITKGDANHIADEQPVHGEDIVGIYFSTVINSAKIASVIKSRQFYFFVLLIPLCLVVFFEALNVSKAVKARKTKNKQDEADERKDNGG